MTIVTSTLNSFEDNSASAFKFTFVTISWRIGYHNTDSVRDSVVRGSPAAPARFSVPGELDIAYYHFPAVLLTTWDAVCGFIVGNG